MIHNMPPRRAAKKAIAKIRRIHQHEDQCEPEEIETTDIDAVLRNVPPDLLHGPVVYFISAQVRPEHDATIAATMVYKVGMTKNLRQRLTCLASLFRSGKSELTLHYLVPFDTMEQAGAMESRIKKAAKGLVCPLLARHLSSIRREIFRHDPAVPQSTRNIMEQDEDFYQHSEPESADSGSPMTLIYNLIASFF